MKAKQELRNLDIKFSGVDRWNRPIYKLRDKSIYFGSVNTLFNYEATEEEVNNYFLDNIEELEYFGNSFGCEPIGGISEDLRLHII